MNSHLVVFFFQAEDGIRDYKVTGVQTCALPIFQAAHLGILGPRMVIVPDLRLAARQMLDGRGEAAFELVVIVAVQQIVLAKIGRASCRERVQTTAAEGSSNVSRDEEPDNVGFVR